jgi:hypothetical protein
MSSSLESGLRSGLLRGLLRVFVGVPPVCWGGGVLLVVGGV